MKKVIFSLLIVAVAATSCQKEVNNDDSNEKQPPAGSVGIYQPVTKGSFWKYKQTGFTNSEYTMTATGTFLKLDGRTYYQFATDFDAGPDITSGLAYQDGKYYTTAKGVAPNGGGTFDLTQLYLNEKEPVAYSWLFDAGQGNGFVAKAPGKILEKGISITVAGKTYNDVIRTQVDLGYEFPGLGLVNVMTYEYYVAKNIGIVKIVAIPEPIPGAPDMNSLVELLDYNIK